MASERWDVKAADVPGGRITRSLSAGLSELDDVRPLDDGDGYQVDIQGGRGPDPRCGCALCCSPKGWAPKNGSRTYHLDPEVDAIGWITPLCDHLDRWIAMRAPPPGDLLIRSPADPDRAWSNQHMNRKFHEIADELEEFKETYGRPDASEVARATLAVYTVSPDP